MQAGDDDAEFVRLLLDSSAAARGGSIRGSAAPVARRRNRDERRGFRRDTVIGLVPTSAAHMLTRAIAPLDETAESWIT
jgi:hypothetical protein